MIKLMKKLLTVFVTVLMLVCSFTTVKAAGETVTITFQAKYQQDDARAMLSKINAFRTGNEAWAWDSTNTTKIWYSGLGTLTYDYGLEKIAMQRAKELAVYYSHTRPDGSRNIDAYTSGYLGLCGENIAWGFYSTDSMFSRWKEDDYDYAGQAHRRNMLKAGFRSVGIGCVEYNGTRYWAMELSNAVLNTTKTTVSSSNQSMSVSVLKSLLKMDLSFDDYTYRNNASIVIQKGEELDVPAVSAYVYANAGRFPVKPSLSVTSSNTTAAKISGSKIVTVTGGWTDIKIKGTWQGFSKTLTLKLGVSGEGAYHIHVYEPDGCEWAEDLLSANAVLICKYDSSHVTRMPCTVTKDVTPATCQSSGYGRYYASFTYEGRSYYATNYAYLPQLEHEWTEPVYMWADDYSSVTGTVRCGVGGETEEETVTAEAEVVKEPTETETGLTVYTAYFSNEHFEDQTIEVVTPALNAAVPEEIALSQTQIVLPTESTFPLEAVLNPEDSDQSVTWSSSDETIAQVDGTGSVKGLRYGSAVITAVSKANPSLSASAEVFTRYFDVADESLYYFKPVYWAAEKAITKGYDNVYFGPKNYCTREAVVTFLWRVAGKPNPKSMKSPFYDVQDKSKYYYKAVLWAAEKGITNGYSDGSFRPDDICLREHVVTFIWRYAGKPAPKTSKNPFNDIQSSAYYYKAAVWANEKGIANGYSEGLHAGGFGPNLDCLREHVVTFLYRYAK
ncbi:MAG: S-layer homology domain-containing protein [Solobacterium sp.]|nr:S-layer homology domain-containing protein [Solobacterium sp.]